VILAPLLFALLGLVIAAGRISIAQSSVNAAARDAARQASISFTAAAAKAAGQASALTALCLDGLDCKPVVLINVSQFVTTEPGEPAAVTATVKCAISLSDLGLPGLPGSTLLQSHFTSPLDVYRSR
jgi:Flp pilus assembly protein TadG